MRFADLFRMALSALARQKLRTLLTTLSVMVGSLILMISLSIGLGVHRIIDDLFYNDPDFRQLRVYDLAELKEKTPPDKYKRIPGNMSDERRARLRKERIRRWKRGKNRGLVPLSEERLKAIAALDHVVLVTPTDSMDAQVAIDGKTSDGLTLSVSSSSKHFRARTLHGGWIASDSDPGVVVSEYLLYKLGVRDESDVIKMLGRQIRLEVRSYQPSPVVVLTLLGKSIPKLSTADEELLRKVLRQLPTAVPNLNLKPEEKERLRQLFEPAKDAAPPGGSAVVSLTIRGIYRVPDKDDPNDLWFYEEKEADVVVSSATAKHLLLSTSYRKRNGLNTVLVEVDHTDNVPAVVKALEGMKLKSRSFAEIIQQNRLGFLLIFSAMTAIAMVALLVAAIGITNVMLMSVMERIREIGIMKAVGARDGHVQRIFLLEGGLIGVIGGALGTGLTFVVAAVTDSWVRSLVQKQLPQKFDGSLFVFPWWLLIGVPLFVAFVTTLAAVLPARRAARVNPVEALRHE